MSADVSDLLASIDDVLETASDVVSAPVPVPAPAGAPVESDTRGDWWDSLYETPQAGAEVEADAEAPEVEAAAEAPVAESRVSAATRLPYWWQKDQKQQAEPSRVDRVEPADTADTAGTQRPQPQKQACEHGQLLPLRAERGEEVVGRLCLDCDERLPAADPEPEAECTHEERLEARSEGGKLIGYVCAATGCGARLTKDEVHGRIGKWLRPAESYYPRPRNPLSPTADGEPPKRALSAGTLRLLANAGAAGAGYFLGLAPTFGAWIEECGETTSIGGALFLGGSICLAIGHFWDRRTRHWYPGLAWAARIPLASAITALALYEPASQV
ncbi:hypothetical protein D8771_26575 [Streptomyces albus]|uniref:Uncharacterized protein n=1 Tax=Streptomyces albus TaxID=1888 RepID=A0A8H1L4F8_9ACTN|nr:MULTISPECIES: hypothetical protein [Streptomyces]TGG77866.1 hypothetical protein D8771_26575 [Streptomyces albus]TXJ73569.1 hypothetical protein E2C11_29085 [Streptomyces lavendulae]